jgi:hypothetical protein
MSTYIISGSNFHGRYSVRLRAGSDGLLTPRQEKRLQDALCPCQDCTCGGGYGDGPDPGSAQWEHGQRNNGSTFTRLIVRQS